MSLPELRFCDLKTDNTFEGGRWDQTLNAKHWRSDRQHTVAEVATILA